MNAKKSTKWEGAYIRVVEDSGWQFVERRRITGIVCMIPITKEGKLVLIEQYRVPVAQKVIEFPAGLVGDEPGKQDEAFTAAAERELLEETGFRAERLEYLFEGVISAGLSDERITYYLAPDCEKVGPGGGDSSEKITVHEVALDSALEWISERTGEDTTVDVKVMAVLSFWRRMPPAHE